MKNINDMGVKEFTIGKGQKIALKCCKRAVDDVCAWKGNPQTFPKSLSQLFIIITIITLFTLGCICGAKQIKCLKQISQIKHNRVKNPNQPEANQLAIYKHSLGFQVGSTMNKSS